MRRKERNGLGTGPRYRRGGPILVLAGRFAAMPPSEGGSWKGRLYIPLYTTVETAHYAMTNPQTVSYWFRGSGLGPVLPGKGMGLRLSYMQLVEAAFVASFRAAGVSLQRVRKARDHLSRAFECQFPFAELRLKTDGKRVLYELEELSEVPGKPLVAADENGQLIWRAAFKRLEQFEYVDDLAVRWFPRGREHPVVIDARVAFGAPTVSGIATRLIHQRWLAKDSTTEIAEDLGVPEKLVSVALQFEGVI
jgi:uncharacterized protein (DUF433 family)